jgi:hypothetical protein
MFDMSARWIDWNQPTLFISLASIAFNPLAWNIVARNGASSSVQFCFVTLTQLSWFRIPQQDADSHLWRKCATRVLLPRFDDLLLWAPSRFSVRRGAIFTSANQFLTLPPNHSVTTMHSGTSPPFLSFLTMHPCTYTLLFPFHSSLLAKLLSLHPRMLSGLREHSSATISVF